MKFLGISGMLLGAMLIAVSFLLGNTVSSPMDAEKIFNLSRGQTQIMVLTTGAGIMIAGAVLAVGGTIRELLLRYIAAKGVEIPPEENDAIWIVPVAVVLLISVVAGYGYFAQWAS